MIKAETLRPRAGDDKIVRQKLSDQVLERLRDKIESGEIAPGELMPSERDLMEQFGVGRPAVREAMQSMHVMGLITIAQGGRARVNQLSTASAVQNMDAIARLLLSSSPDNLEHLKEARRMFEIGMVRTAAEKATESDIIELRDLVARQSEKLGDAEAFIAADMGFHRRIAEISGNPIFVSLSDGMLSWLFTYHSDLLHWSGNEAVTLREHIEIVDSIQAGAPDRATAAMRAHLDRSNDLYRHPG